MADYLAFDQKKFLCIRLFNNKIKFAFMWQIMWLNSHEVIWSIRGMSDQKRRNNL